MKNEKTKYNEICRFLGNHWILCISIILLTISISLNISRITVSNESIVLTFIGILTTFVVVSNYAQVKDVQSQFEQKVIDINLANRAQIEKLESEFNDKSSELFERFEQHEKSINVIHSKILNDYFDNLVDSKEYTKTFNLLRTILFLEIKLKSNRVDNFIKIMNENLNVIENSTDDELEEYLKQEELNLDKDFLAPIIDDLNVKPIIDKIDILNGRIKKMRLSKS